MSSQAPAPAQTSPQSSTSAEEASGPRRRRKRVWIIAILAPFVVLIVLASLGDEADDARSLADASAAVKQAAAERVAAEQAAAQARADRVAAEAAAQKAAADRAAAEKEKAAADKAAADQLAAEKATVDSAASGKPAQEATDTVDFTMPNLVGRNLQVAQDEIQRRGIFFSVSHDVLAARMQVVDSNWMVCSQTPKAGKSIKGAAADWEGKIDFGVVKLTETCP